MVAIPASQNSRVADPLLDRYPTPRLVRYQPVTITLMWSLGGPNVGTMYILYTIENNNLFWSP